MRDQRVAAVYTLGYPRGWRTAQGLKVGDAQTRMRKLYGSLLHVTSCIGFDAHSIRGPEEVTTFVMLESSVSGFALTLPSETVCR